MIIAINGKIGVGKDTFASYIQELDSEWEIKKYADKLKEIGSILTGIPKEKFEDQKFKEEWNSELGMTNREFLQRLGTEALRDNVHTDIWVKALFADYKTYQKKVFDHIFDEYTSVDKNPKWIITDMRFPNEFEAVEERGGVTVRVIREPEFIIDGKSYNYRYSDAIAGEKFMEKGEANHGSETALDGFDFDYEINNNGSLDELKEKAEEFYVWLRSPSFLREYPKRVSKNL